MERLPPDELLDLGPAAEHLGVSPRVLAGLLDSGALPSHRGPDPRRRRVARADLDAHRDARFALKQRLTARTRARRSGDVEGMTL